MRTQRVLAAALCAFFFLAVAGDTRAQDETPAAESADGTEAELDDLFSDLEGELDDFLEETEAEPEAPATESEPDVTTEADATSDAAPEPTRTTPPPAPATPAEDPATYALPPSEDEDRIIITGTRSTASEDYEQSDSIASFGAEDLSALGAQNAADIARFTPNLEIVSPGATTPTFFVRGVGSNDFNANSTGAVAIYQDDVPLNSPALQLSTFLDVTNVNVLRGPIGLGQGRNASAGAIKHYARKPIGEYNGTLALEVGNYDYIDLEGAVEAPVFRDLVSARLAFRVSMRDGYSKNDCGNAPPRSERGISTRINNTDPFDANGLPVSICGETVPRVGTPRFPIMFPLQFNDGISPIETGLPTHVNDLDNWATRATILFAPTNNSDWTLIGRYSKRDELTRLGQAIGTGGSVFDPDCLAALEAQLGRPALPNERNQSGCRIQRVLGGIDAGFYQAPEIRDRLVELNPCIAPGPLGSTVPTGACPDQNSLFLGGNNAQLQVADELANLDSDPYRGQWNRVGPTKNEVWGVTVKSETEFLSAMKLETVTSFDAYDRLVDQDLDQSPNPLFETRLDDRGWQYFQSLNFGAEPGDILPFAWDVGGWYLRERLDVNIENTFLPERSAFGVATRDYRQDLHSFAAYGTMTLDFWDDFTLETGARFNLERKEIDYQLEVASSNADNSQRLRQTWTAPTGGVKLTYRFREDTHAFWKYTRGWKAGTYNATSSAREGVTDADPETIDSFEVGLRGSWFDGRLDASASVFHYNYSDYQIFVAQQTLGAQPEFVILNANKAEVRGAELTLTMEPWEGAYGQVNFGWLDSQFLDFVQRQQGSEQRGGNAIPTDVAVQNSGNPLLNSPQFKVSLTMQQEFSLGRFGSLTPRWDGSWSDDISYDPTAGQGLPNSQGEQFLPANTIGQSAYWIHNVQLTYRTADGFIEVAGWARNVGDKAVKNFAFDASNFNGTTIFAVNQPRTYGFSLQTSF